VSAEEPRALAIPRCGMRLSISSNFMITCLHDTLQENAATFPERDNSIRNHLLPSRWPDSLDVSLATAKWPSHGQPSGTAFCGFTIVPAHPLDLPQLGERMSRRNQVAIVADTSGRAVE